MTFGCFVIIVKANGGFGGVRCCYARFIIIIVLLKTYKHDYDDHMADNGRLSPSKKFVAI